MVLLYLLRVLVIGIILLLELQDVVLRNLWDLATRYLSVNILVRPDLNMVFGVLIVCLPLALQRVGGKLHQVLSWPRLQGVLVLDALDVLLPILGLNVLEPR